MFSIQCRTCKFFNSEKRKPNKQLPGYEKNVFNRFGIAYSCEEGNYYVLEDGTIPYISSCRHYVKRGLAFYMKEVLKKGE